MEPNQIRSLGANLEAKLMAFKHKKGKGQNRVRPSIIVIDAPLAATLIPREDLSYLPPPIIVLGVILLDVPLMTNTGVLIPLKGSYRCLTMERPVLVDEEKVGKEEEKGIRALKKWRRQEAP